MNQLPSPYSTTINRGLVEQVSTILQLTPNEGEALFALLKEIPTMEPDETINDIFDYILVKHQEVTYKRLYQAYEALYSLYNAKRALDTSLKDGNATTIKKALEDLEAYATRLPAQQPDETLTDDQEKTLENYMNMLNSYYQMYEEQISGNTVTN